MSELRQLLYQHPKGVTLSEIAAHLDVTQRSARRYLSEIKVDLEAVPERPGGQKRWRIPSVDLPRRVAIRRTQAYALLAARRLFQSIRGSTLYEEIDLAAQTLLGVARRPGRGANAGVADAQLERRFLYLPFAPKDYSDRAEDLDNVFQAVADLRPLECRYPDPQTGAMQRLHVHPYALLLYKDAIHCLAYDTATDEVRDLLLDALIDTRVQDDERFDLPEDFCVETYVQGQFGIWPTGSEVQQVEIHFDASVRDYVLTRQVHPSQRTESLGDGGVRMVLELGDLTEVASWILGFGSQAEVLAPYSLRERVAAELARAMARYQS